MKIINLRRDVREALLIYFEKYLQPHMKVYDIGCGGKPFSETLQNKVKDYIGVDVEDGFYDSSLIDIIGTAYDVPIDNESADAVISSQVLEHLEYPERAIKETARILKKEGYFFVALPFIYPLHAEPYDYSRITEFKIRNMLEKQGFDILEFKYIGGFWYALGLFLGIYLQPLDRGLVKKIKISSLILWGVRFLFALIHNLEGLIFKLFKKDIQKIRKKWISNYVIVAQKI